MHSHQRLLVFTFMLFIFSKIFLSISTLVSENSMICDWQIEIQAAVTSAVGRSCLSLLCRMRLQGRRFSTRLVGKHRREPSCQHVPADEEFRHPGHWPHRRRTKSERGRPGPVQWNGYHRLQLQQIRQQLEGRHLQGSRRNDQPRPKHQYSAWTKVTRHTYS